MTPSTGLAQKAKLEAVKTYVKNPIMVSAKKHTNLDELKSQIVKTLENYVKAKFWTPINNETMTFISWVHQKADVKKEEFLADKVQVEFEANPQITEHIRRKVEKLNGKFEQAIHPS